MFIPHSEDLTEQPRKRAMSTPTIIKRQKQSELVGRFIKTTNIKVNRKGWNVLDSISPNSSKTLKLNILIDAILSDDEFHNTVKNIAGSTLEMTFNTKERFNTTTTFAINIDEHNFNKYVMEEELNRKSENEALNNLKFKIAFITMALSINLLECGPIFEVLKNELNK